MTTTNYLTQARQSLDQIEAYGEVDDAWILSELHEAVYSLRNLLPYLKLATEKRVKVEVVEETR